MAKKSSAAAKEAAAAPKASAKGAGVKKTAVTKAATPKAETASKSGTPKAPVATAAKKAAAPKAAAPTAKKAAPKKAAGPKLSESQVGILKRIKDAGEAGYAIGQKVEERSITALSNHKLVKRGAKNKETGKHHYLLTKLGEKHTNSGEKTPANGGA